MMITSNTAPFDHMAGGSGWALLILGGEDVLADLGTYPVQIGFRLSFRVKHVADVTVMESAVANWDLFIRERDGGKVKDNPIMAIL